MPGSTQRDAVEFLQPRESPAGCTESPKSSCAAGWVWRRCRALLREGFGESTEPEAKSSVALRF